MSECATPYITEPTSALDQDSARKAERVLKESGAGLIWVTHDDSQPARVGGRVLSLPLGTEVNRLLPEHFAIAIKVKHHGVAAMGTLSLI